MVISPGLLRVPGSRPDLAQFEKVEAERFDLGNDAEHRSLILEHAGEHGLAALQLRRQCREGGQRGSSEPSPYPDRVQARRCSHAKIVQPDLVSRPRRNLVIARVGADYFDDVDESGLESSRSRRADRTAVERSVAPSLA